MRQRRSGKHMEFGKVPESMLGRIDFTLPPDPAVNREVLQAGSGGLQCFAGCARWGNKDWVGKYYPKGTKEKDFLRQYASLFNCIELNTTYYGTPSPAQVAGWKEKASSGFLFCPKLPQQITHTRKLQQVTDEVAAFVDAVTGLGPHLGPLFLMPDPQLGPEAGRIMEQFMVLIPDSLSLFLELRHPEWYREGYDPAMYRFLRAHNRGAVITDTAGRRDCVHMHLTVPRAFIRFVGNGLHPTDYTRIDAWVQRIRQWAGEGLETLYFMMHQQDELHAAALIGYFAQQMKLHCGIALKVPQRLDSTHTLF